jgi:peptidoglycan/LPS O-acetylase OafA/YrhL
VGKKIYFENLDGLRAIAAISVMLTHIATWIPSEGKIYTSIKKIISFSGNGGNYGVIFFFVLSGFLITYLLFHEKETNNKINIRMFYLRRILRIWPLYYLTIFIGFYLYPVFYPEELITASKIYYGLFMANFDHIYNGVSGSGILGVHWSVSVEEQFYLFWPLIFLIRDHKIKIIIFFLLFILSQLFYIQQTDWNYSKYHFLSCIRYLGFGAIIGYIAYFELDKIKILFTRIPKILIFFIYIVCVSYLFYSRELNQMSGIFDRLSELLPFIFFSFVILEQNYNENSIFKIGRYRILTWLGKISYGIYLIHMIAITIINSFFSEYGSNYFILKSLLSVFLTLLISHLSYIYFERYFLNIKTKFTI